MTKTGPFGNPIQMRVTWRNFLGIGKYDDDYNAATNNCIHYGLEVWTRLGGELSYGDVYMWLGTCN